MGLHVGGTYIKVKEGVTQEKVASAIQTYWISLGARPSLGDPFQIKSLSLEKTGQLGFIVTNEESGYISILDSERYRTDFELAQHLAKLFQTEAACYEFTSSVDFAQLLFFDETGEIVSTSIKDWDAIETYVYEHFPYAMLYYQDVAHFSEVERSTFSIFTFAQVPNRPGHMYSGPDEKQIAHLKNVQELNTFLPLLDGSKILLFLQEHPDCTREVLDFLGTLDLHDAKAQQFVLAFIPIAMERKIELNTLAEAVLRVEDQESFLQIIKSMTAGYEFSLLASTGYKLLDEGKLKPALWVYEVVASRSKASPEDLNNLIYLLDRLHPNSVPQEQIQVLLEKALQVAPIHPSIYHNAACLYIKLGQLDKALEMVLGAVKYGYSYLDLIKNDSDLDPIRKDPPFAEQFSDLFTKTVDFGLLDLKSLVIFKSSHENSLDKFVLSRLGIRVGFFLDASLPHVASAVAKVIELLLDYLPTPDTFRFYRKHPGNYASIRKGKIKNDLKKLQSISPDQEEVSLYYSSDDKGRMGQYAFLLEASKLPDADFPEQLSYVSMDFPANEWERVGMENFLNFLAQIANCLPFQSGFGGLSFLHAEDSSMYSEIEERVQILSHRFLGCGSHVKSDRYEIKDCVNRAYWLHFLREDLIQKLGGIEQMRLLLPKAEIRRLEKGIWLRTAKIPPLGYPVHNPQDLGLMSVAARLFSVLRNPSVAKREKAMFLKLEQQPAKSWDNQKFYTL